VADFDFDLFVLGAGSGGVRASRVAAGFGARVAVAEERYFGGTCVNAGCIPKKLLVYASHYREDFADAASGYGWSPVEPSFDWPSLIEKKDAEISRLQGVYRRLLQGSGVTSLEGSARLRDAHTVEVDGRSYRSRFLLVATGSWPSVPELPGAEHGITSNEAFHWKQLPARTAIVGGGYIAVEFAGILHGLGSHVVQLYRGPHFLRGFDDDLRTRLAEEMRKKGVDLRFDVRVECVEKTEKGLRIDLSDGELVEADQLLFATGRTPKSQGLGLEQAGVALDERGAVVVDEYSRTSVDNIYAIGDVTDRIMLTPVAIHEGICVANTLFNDRPMRPDHEDVASAVFSQPPIATVGLTEARARERYGEVEVYSSSFRPLKHTLTGRDEHSFMKLVVDRASDRVVGLHVLGPDAAEIVQGFAVAIKCKATKADFDATIGIHPTAAEELVTMREPVPRD
jgi:glutathione reductase (NADPH)